MAKSFARWPTPELTSLASHFRPGDSRCGVYILEFTNGQRYVGQSVDVVRRFAAHKRRWPDIIAMQFLAVDQARLGEVERQAISHELRADHGLRNIDLVNSSWQASPLDAEVDRPLQVSWVTDGIQDHTDDDRTLRARRRISYRSKYQTLAARPDYQMLLDALTAYVGAAIVWPSHTVERYWTVSALPSTNRRRGFRRLITVSCGKVETFVVYELGDDPSPSWFMNVDAGHVARPDMPRGQGLRYCEGQAYASLGTIGRIEGTGLGAIPAMLGLSPHVSKAARTLALGLMRRQPTLFSRFHCDDLADDILVAMSQNTGRS